MKIKKALLSLIIIMSAVFSLTACGNTNPPSGLPENWFSENELLTYGLENLPIPTATNFNNTIPANSNYLLYLTAQNSNLSDFEKYVQSIVTYLNQHYPNTFGYHDGSSSEAPNKPYNCNRIKKSNILYSYNTAGNTESVYEIFYTPAELSDDVQFVKKEDQLLPVKVKLWKGDSTFHITLKYFAKATNDNLANSIVISLDMPDENIVRYYSIFDGSIVN